MRKILIAANWKMHPTPLRFSSGATRGKSPLPDVVDAYQMRPMVDVVVFPNALDIRECVAAKLVVGGQWGRPEKVGAFTGDVSMKLFHDAGCRYVLCGHSEHQRHHHETHAQIAEQTVAALEAGLQPIVCVGKTVAEPCEPEKERAFLQKELEPVPLQSSVIIAYEPVWAIGTGNTASPEQAQAMHAFIRSLLPQKLKEQTHILYGGSVNANNARSMLLQKDIDGLLVGSASLDPKVFVEIVEIAEEISLKRNP